MKSNSEISENRFLSSLSTSSIRSLLPKSMSSKRKSNPVNPKNPKSDTENAPPIDPNIQINETLPQVFNDIPKQSQSKILNSQHQIARSNSEHEVPDPPIEEAIVRLDGQGEVSVPSDAAVKVVVRIRPMNDHEREGDRMVKKISSDSLSVGDRKFTFDSVLDSSSNQEDIFQLVGLPLVKNSLAGYNTSILSYGQTGSGKTYTMWGPPSAMVEDPSPRSHQGIVPRLFQTLFSEIQREQENSEGRQINYQCRCSFLEIYNEQIGDLIDSTQRNLEIKDDPKHGLYVENLTEEYVTSYDDVTQILIKGLSNRKVGATSINSKSSRSHIVFSCIVESWCKLGTSSKCFSSSRTSRITLVDLAGMDRNKLDDDAGRQCLREGKNVKKSLSQLGHLVSALAKGTRSRKSEDIPYRGSCLTHLLKESLGGNAKLTVICAISPDNKNNGEILSTLRFGQQVRCIRNDPVINEITEDDVNGLSDQIRQLKEELIRAKSSVCSSVGSKNGYFQGRNVRESLNQLRVSLNHSLILPPIDNDSENEVNVDMDDVKELHQQLDKLNNSWEENSIDLSDNTDSIQFYSVEASCETNLTSEDDINFPEDTEIEEVNSEKPHEEVPNKEELASENNFMNISKSSEATDLPFRSSISIIPCSSVLQDPPLSESPKIGNAQRKSMALSSSLLASQNSLLERSKFKSDVQRQSHKTNEHIRSSLQSSKKIFPGATESLAASLQRGLEIIDYHQRNSASSKSSIAFSFEHLTLKPCPEVDKVNVSVQTLPEERRSLDASTSFFCASCRQKRIPSDSNEAQDSLKTWIVAVDETGNPNQLAHKEPKDEGNDTSKAVKRVKELEHICMEQAAKIDQLNRLVDQYKREREHNSIEQYDQEGNTYRLEALEKEIVLFQSLENEDKLLKCNSVESHLPGNKNEIYETKEVQEESDIKYGENVFDMNEKEALLKEIQSLRSKLQSYTDASPKMSAEKLRSSLLSRSIQLRKSIVVDSQHSSEEELERERQRWMEMESDWISLTDELRIDLESNRQRAEKVAMELKLEKKCTEELDDALHRAVLGHARFVEHYADLQEKYNDLAAKHRAIMEGIAEVKRAAAKAGTKGHGSRFAKSLAAELSALRVEREREREFLKKENKSLRIQLRDTAEAVHAAGELLVRLREAENAASVAQDNFTQVEQDNEKLKKQMEKLKRKHKMEMITMKQYLAESRLPESALQPLYKENDSQIAHSTTIPSYDDQAWRAEFGAIYQEHHY